MAHLWLHLATIYNLYKDLPNLQNNHNPNELYSASLLQHPKNIDVDSPSWVVKKTVASLTTAGSDRHREKIIPSQSSTSSPLKSYYKGRPKLEENANLPYFVAPFFTVKNCWLLKTWRYQKPCSSIEVLGLLDLADRSWFWGRDIRFVLGGSSQDL